MRSSVSVLRRHSHALMGPSGLARARWPSYRKVFTCQRRARLLDGIDERHLSANELRSYFGVVPQDTVLSPAVCAKTCCWRTPCGFEQITAACKVAQIHEVIERLPNGTTPKSVSAAPDCQADRNNVWLSRVPCSSDEDLIFDEGDRQPR